MNHSERLKQLALLRANNERISLALGTIQSSVTTLAELNKQQAIPQSVMDNLIEEQITPLLNELKSNQKKIACLLLQVSQPDPSTKVQ